MHALELPTGFQREGRWWRSATLRALTGADELALSAYATEPVAVRVSHLLARLLTRLGPISRVETGHVSELTVGDREALLLGVRRTTSGERLQSTLRCPHCEERLDLNLSLADALTPSSAAASRTHLFDGEVGGQRWVVTFRLPTGADQAAVAARARDHLASAARALFERCLTQARRDDARIPPERVPAEVATLVAKRMAELDPQAETLLEVECPACGGAFSAELDAWSLVAAATDREQLFAEVHTIASHYHWSEAAILALSHERRWTYLRLLADGLGPS